MNLQPGQEIAVLVEDDGGRRAFPIPTGSHTVIERCHVSPTETTERIWMNDDGERALTGQRVFREVLPPQPPDEPERPLYDELNVKFPEDVLPPGAGSLYRRGFLSLRRGGRVK